MNFLRQRWVRRAFLSLGGLVALVVLGLTLVLHSLDASWIKARIQRVAKASGGVDIDYRIARIDLLTGLHVEGLVVKTPGPMYAVAPELLRVKSLDARWSLSSLFSDRVPKVTQLGITEVTFTMVTDENGQTSLDPLTRSDPNAPPKPAVPLSKQAAKFLANAPALAGLEVMPITVVLVTSDHGIESARTKIDGLALAFAASPAPSNVKGWRVRLELGTATKPLDLSLARTRTNDRADAHAKFWLTLDANAEQIEAAMDLRGIDQTFAANISAAHGVHLEAKAHFDEANSRTSLTLERLEASEGAASANAIVELPDAGDPIVEHAHVDLDAARLLSWLPADMVPLTAERARIRADVDSFALGTTPHFANGGMLAVDANVSDVATNVGGAARLDAASLTIHARPEGPEGIAAKVSLKIAGGRITRDDHAIAIDDLTIDCDGTRGRGDVFGGTFALRFARIEQQGSSPLIARDGKLEVQARATHLDRTNAIASSGDLAVSLALGSLDTQTAAMHAHVDGLDVTAHSELEGHPPYAANFDVRAARLRLADAAGRVLADAPARIRLEAHGIEPDPEPLASRGVARLTLNLGDVDATVEATKSKDALDYGLQASARSLRIARAWLTPDLLAKAPWDNMGLTVRSSGHVDDLQSEAPSIRHKTSIDIDRFAFNGTTAHTLGLTIASQGSALQHHADIDVHAQALSVGSDASMDEHLTLTVTVNRAHPSLQFKLASEGRAAMVLSGSIKFDPAEKTLPYEFEGHLAQLAPLARFAAGVHGLEGIDLSALDLALTSRGSIVGVVQNVRPDGSFTLVPNPTRSGALTGDTDLRATHFRWTKGDTAVVLPTFAWHGAMRFDAGKRTLDSRVEIDSVHVDVGSKHVEASGIRDAATASVVGDLLDPEIEMTQRLAIHAVDQDFVPEYPLGDLSFSISAERGPERIVHVSEMNIANAAGGTTFTLTGNIDLGEGRRSLSLATSLEQDLARFVSIPDRFKGKGKLGIEAKVTSPDLTIFRVHATVKADDVTVSLPRAGIEVEAARGEVPITATLESGEKGFALLGSEKRSAYSMLRFADQHPLLTHSGFLSIARIKTPYVTIAPLVGNLEIDQNVISLRQFEMGVRGGRITGQCGIDWEGPRSTVELHVRASGVQSSHGEPFDGNIAVAISAADRTVEGRAEVLRIGERHLLDLLDLQDPHHVDPAMNRIRTALHFGYPDNMRLVFDHGFVSAHLELGGLARLVTIGELRGIPMGPIMDKMLGPIFDESATKDTR